MRIKRLVAAALVVAAGSSALVATACAQADVAQFYAGKTITILIGYGVGGGYDAYARLLSRHLGRHVPGSPTIVPQNMPGAGGLKAANNLLAVAPRDGTAIGTFSEFLTIAPLLGTVQLDAAKFTWIGSVRKETKTCVFSTASPISSWNDMLTTPHKVGGQAPGTEVDLITNIIRGLFHTKTQIVTGYNGQREVMLAIERGEIDGTCGQSYESFTSVFADQYQRKVAKMVSYAALEPFPPLRDIPNIYDLATTAEQKGVVKFIFSVSSMSRSFAAPPGIPDDRKAALRKAFDDTMSDPQFLADAQQQKLEVTPLRGIEIEKLQREIYETPKDIIAHAAQLAQMP